jgi:hypothetical protein
MFARLFHRQEPQPALGRPELLERAKRLEQAVQDIATLDLSDQDLKAVEEHKRAILRKLAKEFLDAI